MTSGELYARALKVMVGGVSSPVRAFKAVGGTPLFIAKGKGSQIWDEDGDRFTDYVCSWGAMVLGHADARVLSYVRRRLKHGTSFGAPTMEELLLAEKITRAIPSVERIRFVNSGTEATMSALRLARGYTKRSKVLKFEGCYHGHADSFLARAGSGLATFDLPSSAGVTPGSTSDTVTLPYNDVGAVEDAFMKQGNDIAGVIVEPVAGNMGVVPPARGFLEALRKLTEAGGSLLIFDEVITGFRVGPQGAQGLYGVKPDLTTLGKIIGGGLPVGAYGGRRDIMSLVSPEGPVYQAGTLSGNPLAMAAGNTTLEILGRREYRVLEARTRDLEEGMAEASRRTGIPVSTSRVGSMLGVFFAGSAPRDFAAVKATDTSAYARFFHEMLKEGMYLPPSAFETLFVSASHSKKAIQGTSNGALRALRRVRG